jgi:hypothetical protein
MNKRLLVAVTAAAAAALAAPFAASADPPWRLSGPPTANVVGIFACANPGVGNGQWQVPAGQPFAVRLSGWVSGTQGLVESFIPKDASTVTVERPLGTVPVPSPFQWQSPTLQSDGAWVVLRWSPVFTLSAGEQMQIVLTAGLAEPARDLIPPSSSWDPELAGFPPYDGTGLKYDGGVVQPFTGPPVACTITGI